MVISAHFLDYRKFGNRIAFCRGLLYNKRSQTYLAHQSIALRSEFVKGKLRMI